MKAVFFSHSPFSDRGEGEGQFLRGIVAELQERGHEVTVFASRSYSPQSLDLDRELDDAELVLVQERCDPELVWRVGAHHARHGGYCLLFHDTGHRAMTAPQAVEELDLVNYDGVLTRSEAIRGIYLQWGWAERAWTWHEAVDTRVFRPLPEVAAKADLVWIGNWGDGERGEELREFLLRPARKQRLHGSVYGARYPRKARLRIALAGLRYRGWSAEQRLPELFARHRLTVDIPRRPYVEAGIPTTRLFEALACGIPLICSPWEDVEGLFRIEQDYLVARDCAEMREAMQAILENPDFAARLRANGLETIRSRHTCAHRVDELLAIDRELSGAPLAAAG